MLKDIFWRGAKVTLPLILTVALVLWAFSIIEGFFRAILIQFIPNLYFPGLGLLVGLTLVFIAGVAMNMWLAQKIYDLGERVLRRIPGIKTIYNAFVDLLGFLDPQNQRKGGKPVTLETPFGAMIAFIMVEKSGDLPGELSQSDLVAVYIPFSYQIGGYTAFVKKEYVKPLNIPLEKAMSYIVTAGMTGPINGVIQVATVDNIEGEGYVKK